jgi:hypothetical protein
MSEPRPISERIRGMAADHEVGTSRGRAEQIAARAVARARADGPARRRSPVAVLVGVTLLFALVVGLGALADSAVPGQFLYSVDRAYESVGFGGNGAEERLEEAIVLVDRGDADRAVVAVNEALEEISKRSSVSIAVPPIALPAETTTTVAEQDDTAAASASVAELPAESTVDEPDPVQALKLAAEYLLRTVREQSAEEDLEQAASELAAAAASLETTTTTTMAPTTESTSTTTTTEPSTTTTTVDEPGNGNGRDKDTTTTTIGDSSTTTVPEDGESTTTTTVPPIVLPPAP